MTTRYYYFPDGDRFDHIILAEAKDYEELEAKCEHTTRMLESLYVDHKALVERLESLQRANAGLEAAKQWADRRYRSLLKDHKAQYVEARENATRPSNAGGDWTPSADQQLLRSIANNTTCKRKEPQTVAWLQVARECGRSILSVLSRAALLAYGDHTR